MTANHELSRALLAPPPRPLRAVLRGPAVRRSAVHLAIALAAISAAFYDIAHWLVPRWREPLLGNEEMILAWLVAAVLLGGFVVSWSLCFIHAYSVHLYRTGRLLAAEVEKAHLQEKGGKHAYVLNWYVEDRGKVTRGALQVPVRDVARFRAEVGRGDTLYLLAPGRDAAEAIPVGTLDLDAAWVLFPSAEEPGRAAAIRLAGALWLVGCIVVAATGLLGSVRLDGAAPTPFALAAAGGGLAALALFLAASRRCQPWMRPGGWLPWGAAIFVGTFFMVFGAAQALNARLDPRPPRTHVATVVHLDDAIFPVLHRWAFVRSWRPGRVTEKAPLTWRQALVLSPGDELAVTVREGRFGVPVVTGVSTRVQ